MTVGYLQPPLSLASPYVRTGCTTTMTVVIWFVVFELHSGLQAVDTIATEDQYKVLVITE